MKRIHEISRRDRQRGSLLKLKRLVDVLISFGVLIFLSPLLFTIGISLLMTMGHPILFRQQRPGKHGKPFTLYKLRTMTGKRDARGNLLPDGERLTRLGSLMRRFSVDELPQLWNVLRGDLSLVGPRPLLMHYLDRYSHEQARRHDVLPGITGWAQINGRNAITWEQKFTLDLWYVDHWTFWLDIKILWLTAKTLLRPKHVSSKGYATAPEFMGSPNSEETHCKS